jgi:DNA-binding MarR family transcriptional regulator
MQLVELTSRGVAFISDILPEHFRRISVLMSALSEAERRSLVRLLGKVAGTASDAFPAAAPQVAAAIPA